MGSVIIFPEARRVLRIATSTVTPAETGSVVILPVVRIERHANEPSDGLSDDSSGSGGGKRRGRATR
jgi:hypothetical protein